MLDNTRSFIEFFLNGNPRRLEVSPHQTVLELLRGPLALPGTKEGCAEGDCGACTVVIGENKGGKFLYRAVTSCLMLAPQLDGKHLITIEGLAKGEELHPIQQAVLDAHATQCGFCTPGVIMSLLALFLGCPQPSEKDLVEALEGNLCRCTGYVAIKSAGEQIRTDWLKKTISDRDLRPAFLDEAERRMQKECEGVSLSVEKDGKSYHAPRTVEQLRVLLKRYGAAAQLLGGGTDIVVAIKKHDAPIVHLIDLSRLEGMASIEKKPDELRIGGGASLERIAAEAKDVLPVLSETIGKMASNQVRTLGTMAGNLANASPIADTAPLLLVLGASLVLENAEGCRAVPLSEFYRGYKDTALAEGEWIKEIIVPLQGDTFASFEKASKRRALDIATVNGAISLRLEGKKIKEARVAFGGVAAVPFLAPRTAAALEGREWDRDAVEAASRAALDELRPIGDVRGSAVYRKDLVQGILAKHLLRFQGARKGK